MVGDCPSSESGIGTAQGSLLKSIARQEGERAREKEAD
jgi:hypothetical protein